MTKRITKARLLDTVSRLTPDSWTTGYLVRNDGTRCVWGQLLTEIGVEEYELRESGGDSSGVIDLLNEHGYDADDAFVSNVIDLNDESTDFDTFKRAATAYLRDGKLGRAQDIIEKSRRRAES